MHVYADTHTHTHTHTHVHIDRHSAAHGRLHVCTKKPLTQSLARAGQARATRVVCTHSWVGSTLIYNMYIYMYTHSSIMEHFAVLWWKHTRSHSDHSVHSFKQSLNNSHYIYCVHFEVHTFSIKLWSSLSNLFGFSDLCHHSAMI